MQFISSGARIQVPVQSRSKVSFIRSLIEEMNLLVAENTHELYRKVIALNTS